MIFKMLMLACVWQQIFGQFEDGIVFNNDKNSAPVKKPAVSPAPMQAMGETCNCVPEGTCPTPAPVIDIRIVNNASNGTCAAGYVMCCSIGPSPTVPPDPTCGIRKIQPVPQPVVGQASFGAYPWQAALLTIQEAFVGSGVLLSNTHVLTAAHKVAAYVNNPSSLLVRLGEWNAIAMTEPYQYVQLTAGKITVHPNFNPTTLENDVAVIKLMGVVMIPSYPNINTACKPTAAVATGTRCYVSGWGKNLFGPNGSYQSIMREVDVPILDINECEKRLRQTRLGAMYMLNKTSFLCAGGELGKDACTGDGGSPLVCQNSNGLWTVYGLVAWGIGCASLNVPGVYTNVFNFMSWINNAVATT